jgi:hypothetical protein
MSVLHHIAATRSYITSSCRWRRAWDRCLLLLLQPFLVRSLCIAF